MVDTDEMRSGRMFVEEIRVAAQELDDLRAMKTNLLGVLRACVDRLALHAVHGNLDVIDAANAAIKRAEGL